MPLAEILVFGGCSLAAALTQSISGFGFGIVLVGLLPVFGVGIRDVVVLITILVVPNLCICLWRLRRHVSLRRVGWLLVGIPLGIPFGIWLQDSGSETLVRSLLGGVLILAGIEPFFRRRWAPGPPSRAGAVATGAASGVLGAAFATGGPPVVIYFYRRQWSKEVTKACMLLTFVGTVSMRLVPYVWKGWVTPELLRTGAVLCPAVIVGTLLGERVFHIVSQEGFRRVVAVMLVVLGLYQIGKVAGM